MNLNAITGSKTISEPLPVETLRPVSARENAADKIQTTQTVKPTSDQTGLNGNGKNNDKLSVQEAQKTVDDLNEYMNDLQTNIGFSIHEKLDHQVVIEIKNRKSNEIIRQVPTEELISIKVKMEELSGLLFDEKI